jgi:hypothetical protein
MAISRPFLLALLGVALLGATVFAVQNARNTATDDPAPVAKQPADQAAPAPAPEPAQASVKLSAKDALASIFSPGEAVDSARFSIRYDLREQGGANERSYGSVSGQFVSKGDAEVPDFDIRVTTGGESSANFHAIVADGKPYVGQGGEFYEGRASGVKNLSDVRGSIADSPVADFRPFDLSRWLDNVKVEGVEKVDGVDTTHVSGDFVAGDAIADVVKLIRAEARDGGGQSGVPANFQKTAKSAIEKTSFDAWVGSDRVMRRVRIVVQLDVPRSFLDPGDSPRGTATLDLRLSKVNEIDAIEAPSNVADASPVKGMGAKDAEEATEVLAVSGLAVDAPGGVTGATWSFLRLARIGNSTEVAKKVLRAVEQHKPAVVFFRNPKALDDDATADSVKYLETNTKKLAVFTDDVANTRRYGRLVENLGVTQAPAIVFINRRGKASLVEGYVDGPSLAQVIADAR